jgi:DNA invertase Pin-like site-specific DNA recombinase
MEKKVAYYIRSSHFTQSTLTQQEKIEPGWKVYKDEGVSGRIDFENRPAGKRLIEDCKKGLISRVVILRIDRCGRSTQNIISTLSTFNEMKIPVTSLNEGITTLDTNGNITPTTSLLINVLSSLSQYFYELSREKLLSGILLAKKDPTKYVGRKPNSVEDVSKYLNKPKVKKMTELVKQGNSVRSIVRVLNCSPNSIYKLKKVLETNNNV